jgi:hypothetical protein
LSLNAVRRGHKIRLIGDWNFIGEVKEWNFEYRAYWSGGGAYTAVFDLGGFALQ